MKDLISVIVPVYNVEAYLPMCLESIINQTYKNLEIILINDGSTDNSLNICKNYAKKDDRIVVKTQKNKGLSATRNKGIEMAHGKYIGFVDADDVISLNMYEYLYRAIIQDRSQLSICNYIMFDKEKPIFTKKYQSTKLTTVEALKQLMIDKDITNHAVDKLYLRDLFDGIEFPVDRKYEDIATTYKLFLSANSISYVPCYLYGYYQRVGSITGEYNKNTNLDFIKAIDDRYKELYDFDKDLNIYLKLNRSNMALRYFLDIVKFRRKGVLKDKEYMVKLYRELNFSKVYYKEFKKFNSIKRNILLNMAYINIYLFYYVVYFYERISGKVL